jgi:hypothetical protein
VSFLYFSIDLKTNDTTSWLKVDDVAANVEESVVEITNGISTMN